ncbi:MAG TPA: hypothetical protein HA257_04620 [Candidatus Methanoperedenaceae archaeon]|nr:hypothetical protein [Candidatus Methanoperedenaceae archaeon]
MDMQKSIQWLIVAGIILMLAEPVLAGDPNGAVTYKDDIAGMKLAVNFTWTLLAAFLVFFM